MYRMLTLLMGENICKICKTILILFLAPNFFRYDVRVGHDIYARGWSAGLGGSGVVFLFLCVCFVAVGRCTCGHII